MRVRVVRGGGLAGLTSTTVVDAADLSAQDALALGARVRAAGLLNREPPAASARTAGADRFSYELTIDLDGRRSSVRVGEADLSAELRELLEFVRTAPGRTHHVGPSGAPRPDDQ